MALEPTSMSSSVGAALAQSTGLRLELERRAWLRLGRDVVGQRTAVVVAKNRYGPPGRSVDLDIHYLEDGERSPGVHRLVSDGLAAMPSTAVEPVPLRAPPERLSPRLVVV